MNKKIFNEEYKNIKKTIENDLENFNVFFENYFSFNKVEIKQNQIIPILKEFVDSKGKKIRSLLMFLTTKALKADINEDIFKLAAAEELLHNATLIHDDIIDCSLYRREQKTLNFDYDSKLAVLAGDYLLCEVLKILSEFENNKIRDLYSNAMSKLINGELYQYFNRFKICSIDDYIEKSKNKTAKLFEAGLAASAYVLNCDETAIKNVSDFALNFGIGFQIHNDLKNFYEPEKLNEDIKNGDYSAPLIFYIKEKYGDDAISLNNVKLALKHLKHSNALQKTKNLIQEYFSSAIENIAFLEDNLYKRALVDLCNLFIKTAEYYDG